MLLEKSNNPFEIFDSWYSEAKEHKDVIDHTAVALATCNAQLIPSVRMVLLKHHNEDGFVFYTNLGSHKSHDLKENPYAALCFHWASLKKQIRISGSVSPVTDKEADDYFASRPRQSQLGAWASKQSHIMKNPHDLEKRIAEAVLKFPVGSVPRPEFWSGFRVKPDSIEFWHDKKFRLHDRYIFHSKSKDNWKKEKLFP